MRTALVAICGPAEKHYINEWITYHLKIGFDEIYLYINNWEFKTRCAAVHCIQFDGHLKQLEAYQHFISNHSDKCDYALFIDCDEFLNLNECENVNEMFRQYGENEFALAFNWRLFGDSGLKFDGERSVLKRFVKCQIGFNHHLKTAINFKKCRMHNIVQYIRFADPHSINLSYCHPFTKSVDGNFTTGPWHKVSDITAHCWRYPYINHYFTKTFEEWKERRSLGRADILPGSENYIRKDSEFDEHNFNEREDLRLKNFAEKNM